MVTRVFAAVAIGAAAAGATAIVESGVAWQEPSLEREVVPLPKTEPRYTQAGLTDRNTHTDNETDNESYGDAEHAVCYFSLTLRQARGKHFGSSAVSMANAMKIEEWKGASPVRGFKRHG